MLEEKTKVFKAIVQGRERKREILVWILGYRGGEEMRNEAWFVGVNVTYDMLNFGSCGPYYLLQVDSKRKNKKKEIKN